MLDSGEIQLRYFQNSDAPKARELSNEKGQAKWMPDQVYKDEEMARKALQFLMSKYKERPNPRMEPYVLAIEHKATGELIGHVGLSPYKKGVEIGYAIADSYSGQGYATTAVGLMSNWALKNIKIEEIYAVAVSENIGSVRVLEKAGYAFVEELERSYHGKNRLCTIYCFSL